MTIDNSEDTTVIKTLGLDQEVPLERLSRWQRVWQDVVWLLTRSDTELVEVGLWGVTAYWWVALALSPRLLETLPAYALILSAFDQEFLAVLGALLTVLSFAAYAAHVEGWGGAAALRREVTRAYGAFYGVIGGGIWWSMPAAPGLGWYWFAVLASTLTYLRLSHRQRRR